MRVRGTFSIDAVGVKSQGGSQGLRAGSAEVGVGSREAVTRIDFKIEGQEGGDHSYV
jgi:hypothetical protein